MLIEAIRSHSDAALEELCRDADLLAEAEALDGYRRTEPNLYLKVRALFFLYAIHRFNVPRAGLLPETGRIPYEGFQALLNRRFDEAIDVFLAAGPSEAASSALAAAYKSLAFQTLANQVRRSVRSLAGNQWMFRTGHPADLPLRLRPELLQRSDEGLFPILRERTPVRMDLSHSGWSDIFFLGMDYPEGARVLNISIDLKVRGSQSQDGCLPPCEAWLRVIDEPVLRLVSVDLGASTDVTSLAELFDFARDYLGLLKAAVIASGLVPAGIEGAQEPFESLLRVLTGRPNHGLELVSKVNDIPKGSRLAVSTNLLAALIGVLMRATRQAKNLTGALSEQDRRIVAARAILGEWLGGSGGGWQDSGGLWPGAKVIKGVASPEGSESRGALLPAHDLITLTEETRRKLEASLVLVHGGMAQDVGPILEMVTERYLLRSGREWQARHESLALFEDIRRHLESGDIRALGKATEANFRGPLQAIIPWATNHYTETLIEKVRSEFGDGFWGFWMLGGMSGGGMGFMFHPDVKPRAQARLQEIMRETRRSLEKAVPYAMDPVVYDFAINERGTWADMQTLMPAAYYALTVPALVRKETRLLPPSRRAELEAFSATCPPDLVQTLFTRLLPRSEGANGHEGSLAALLEQHGFDRIQHEQIRSDLRSGRIGLAQNRLPVSTTIEDVRPGDLSRYSAASAPIGEAAIRNGELAIVTLAGGAGSRWTRGAGVVKALNPFIKLNGKHRSFLDIHLVKFQGLPHVITASYLNARAFASIRGAYVSPGKSIGLRFIPTERDLRYAYEETAHQLLDEQKQKVRESLQHALIEWAKQQGQAADYTDNLPTQCIHPLGHWYEVPNMLLNGTLARLYRDYPNLRYLLVHNVDTLGVTADPAILGHHIETGAALTVEVIARNLEDRGGGLARIDGRLRLIEGLALPDERIEFDLTWYNTNTFWIDLEQLLRLFGVTKDDVVRERTAAIRERVRHLSNRIPTYITLKDVKKRWGKGQEDIFPVAQWEKLWGDMTALPELQCNYVAAPRLRGQQLKEIAQLDAWVRDGSAEYVARLCGW